MRPSRQCVGGMVRVVLDTVVLVRALINPYGAWGRIVFAWAGRYRLVISPPLLAEYLEVLSRPELTRKFARLPDRRRDLLDLLTQAEIVTLVDLPTFDRDPGDAHVLATAARGGVDYLISGDKDLLDLREYEGIPILGAAGFIRRWEHEYAGEP